MQFRKTKSFGPRISLTERQIEKTIARFNGGGLTCFIENCPTGSVYVAVGLPEWSKNIRGEWFNNLDCGCADDVAKIRLSGHDSGRRADYTHNCVGSKRECMAALTEWTEKIIAEHGQSGRDILAAVPDGALAE